MFAHSFDSVRASGITINLEGGVGNQLFQYAAGLSLANRHGCKLTINTSRVKNNRHGGECITDFALPDICQIDNALNSPVVDNRIMRSLRFRMHPRLTLFKTYFSSRTGFDEKLMDVPRGSQIQGYFQTYKYWEMLKHQNSVSTKMELKSPSPLFDLLRNEAQECLPIVLHFRRGDYYSLSQDFGLLAPNYYRVAVEKLVRMLPGPPIWVYSDDFPAAKRGLAEFSSGFNVRYVEETEKMKALEVLALMSIASGHIIANSSFSWWSANLSSNSSVVIAPDPWFRGRTPPLDLIPNHWLRQTSEWD